MSNKIRSLSKKRTKSIDMGTLYEVNKNIMQQTAKPLTIEELTPIQKELEDWFNWELDSYAMLLCHERRDYTVFHLYEKQNPNPPALAAKELIECLLNRGEVLSIEKTEDKAWEIWLKIEEEYCCYYLFNYDNAVIEV